jgi:hypothetical protein
MLPVDGQPHQTGELGTGASTATVWIGGRESAREAGELR